MNFHSQALINLSCFHHNFKVISEYVGENVYIIPVIKADGYGHGIVRMARELETYKNVAYLGVAHIKEGVLLRKNGIKQKILAMSCIDSFDMDMTNEFDITPVVHNIYLLKKVLDYAKKIDKQIKIHLKFDTGMARLGIRKEDVEEALTICKNNKDYIKIDGLMSHFSDSESDKDWTMVQFENFKNIIRYFEDSGFDIKYKHIANSAAILNYKKMHLNCVRPGIILYGCMPSPYMDKKLDLKPVLEIKSQLVSIHPLKKGEVISYGRTFTADRDIKVGVVAFGYADGLFRSLSNKMECIVKGVKCKNIGTICMDMFMCDLTGVDADVSDEVIIIGKDKESSITIDDLAKKSQTINHEILTNIGKSIRVQRIYLN